MSITLYNSLSRQKEDLTPIHPDQVGMYVCGPTVYDRAHIGNARPVIVFDILYRMLQSEFSKVTYVRNITDIDDKIIDRAAEIGQSISELTEVTERDYVADMAYLGNLNPTFMPRATEHIPEMIAMIEKLIAKGYAYQANDHVLFEVSKMANYGALSGRKLEDMQAGARVEVADYKRNPFDFVLWKPSDDQQPGWESPWGRGRPGWHIECSAMSEKILGKTFDIHGGGIDLVFPHHENEIAQSCCAHDSDKMANIWMHNGFLMVEGEKMSKSLGNFITVADLQKDHPGEAIRWVLMSTHYRQPIDFTKAGLAEATKILSRFYTGLKAVDYLTELPAPQIEDVKQALRDDLNVPLAISCLHEQLGRLNKAQTDIDKAQAKSDLVASGALLGILQDQPDQFLQRSSEGGLSTADIEAYIQARQAARQAKNYAESDRIRDELLTHNIQLLDGPNGTSWQKI